MRERLADYTARFILATRAIDRWYQSFDRVRSKLILAGGTDGVVGRFNDLTYGATDAYRAGSATFQARLFFWEADAVERFFPAPPARVLVGGAGGGREAFALARKGYQVVAFDPSTALVEAMSAGVTDGMCVQALTGGYEDMPRLFAAELEAARQCPAELRPFDAAIMGWWSFAHVKTEAQRVQALRDFGQLTNGPILVSFSYLSEQPSRPSGRSRRRSLLHRGLNQEPGNIFSIHIGFYHRFNIPEIARLIQQAGLRMIALNTTGMYDNWPHAILIPADMYTENKHAFWGSLDGSTSSK
jgi:SAM-dependent methyltransferase